MSRVRAKKGFATLAAILVALAITASVVYFSGGLDSLTGAAIEGPDISAQVITSCNISVWESINNIGHDYECYNANGFILRADGTEEDPIVIDCKNHSITLMTNITEGYSGMWLNGHSNVKIQNCRIYNFTAGVLLDEGSADNEIVSNLLEDNTAGLALIGVGTLGNHIHTNNLFYNDVGVGTVEQNNSLAWSYSSINDTIDESEGNVIYDNHFINGTGQIEAYSDNTSYNYWHAKKTCQDTIFVGINDGDGNTYVEGDGVTYADLNLSTTNIRGGRCIGGNWWSTYYGFDTTGDGLGDTDVPHLDGGLGPVHSINEMIGDWYPLTDQCALPGVICGDVTCPDSTIYTDEGGEGIAITCDNTNLTCEGTQFVGMNSGPGHMRGIEIIGVENITVTGCEILNFTYGFYVQDSKNVVIDGVSVHDNNETGIYFGLNTMDSIVKNSEIANKDTLLWGNSSGDWVQDVNWTSTGLQNYGFDFQSALPQENPGQGNTIVNNTIYNHTSGDGIRLRD